MDVFNPAPELIEVNPLRKVPVLRFKSGQVINDSNEILSALYAAIDGSPLIPWGEEDLVHMRHCSGLATGLCERLVEYHLEHIRPEAKRDEEILAENRQIFEDTFAHFEKLLGDRETLCGSGLSQADLDLGTALTYACLRYNADALRRYPGLSAYRERLERRPSFQATVPPR